MSLKSISISRMACLALAGLMCSTLPARAESPRDYPIYGGFALGFPAADEECGLYSNDCDGTDLSFKVYAGKRVHENLALEASYQTLGKLSDKQPNQTTTADTGGLNLSVLGIIPVFDNGYFYGKAGVMFWEADYRSVGVTTTSSSDDGREFTFGAGYAFTFDEKYEFRIEYERLNELDDNFTPGGSYVSVLSFAGTINFE